MAQKPNVLLFFQDGSDGLFHNRQTEFKVAEKDGILGFYDEYLSNQEKYGNVRGVLSQPQTPPPPNAYTVSCVPWIEFRHFAVHSYENKSHYFPSVEAGKFFNDSGRTFMPLSMTCHHATTDGWHVNGFLKSLQEDFDQFSLK